jgi:hypothetical protein
MMRGSTLQSIDIALRSPSDAAALTSPVDLNPNPFDTQQTNGSEQEFVEMQ